MPTVETEKKPVGFEKVTVRPEEMEIPEKIEAKEGVQATRTQFTTQVMGDDGKPLTSSPSTKTVTISLPADDAKLTKLSKGSAEDAVTWWSRFWIRTKQKAIHFGWKIVGKDINA